MYTSRSTAAEAVNIEGSALNSAVSPAARGEEGSYIPGKFQYLRYVSDDGTTYALKTRARYLGALDQTVGGTVMLGFSALQPGDPPLPRGMKPRTVRVQDPSGGATRSVPVGSVTAPAWTGSRPTLQCDYSGIGTLTDMVIVGRTAEKPAQLPHQIINVSDAS